MTESESSRATPSWARWLLEAGNAVIVSVALLCALVSVTESYSDEQVRQSLVDTYEGSAWNFVAVCLFALLGIGCAVLARVASHSRTRRHVDLLQIALMIVSIGVAAYEHHRLMQRTTALTGQTFGGFP